MFRTLTLCAGAAVAVLLFSTDASACGKRRASNSCCCASYDPCGASYGYGASPYAGQMGAPGYGYGGYGYGGGAYGGGGYGYNPGGLGGPASGLGVRPGVGVGGLGPRR